MLSSLQAVILLGILHQGPSGNQTAFTCRRQQHWEVLTSSPHPDPGQQQPVSEAGPSWEGLRTSHFGKNALENQFFLLN